MKYVVVMIMAFTLCNASCGKDKVKPSDSIIGQWRWVKTVGGIGGFTYTPKISGYTQQFQFNADSTFKFIRKDTIASQGKFSIVRNYKYGGSTYDVLKTGQGFSGFDQSVVIRNDTLFLEDIFISDGYGSQYVRAK